MTTKEIATKRTDKVCGEYHDGDHTDHSGHNRYWVAFREGYKQALDEHSVAYVVTRCEEHSDYVEEVFFDIEKAEQYCAKYNSNEDNYCRHITKVNVTL